MPAKRPHRGSRSATNGSLAKRVQRVEAHLKELVRARVNVRRDEHDEVLRALKRIAQRQGDLDGIKAAWNKMVS